MMSLYSRLLSICRISFYIKKKWNGIISLCKKKERTRNELSPLVQKIGMIPLRKHKDL